MSRGGSRRGRLKPLTVSAGFREFALDQLSAVEDLEARAMFGAIGLYAGDVFFAILAADTLYFKVDEASRPAYEAEGATPFQPYADRAMKMGHYYSVPASVLEDPTELLIWARRAIAAARAAKRD